MLPILLFTSLLLGAVVGYLLWIKNWDHWEKKGVPGPKASFPYGNVKSIFDGQETFGDFLERTISKYPEEPLIGFYSFFKPMLIVNDPDLVKIVLVQNFHDFVDNAIDLSDVDSLLKKSLFWIKGYKMWKETRALFTPSFTSSKLKTMFPILVESTQRHFDGRQQKEVDTAEVFQSIKLMLHDSVLRIAFGVEVDLDNEIKNAHSPYKEYLEGDLFVDRKGSHLLSCASHLAHWYLKFSKRRVVSHERHNFYLRFINTCVNARKGLHEQRNDILQAIINVEKKHGKPGFSPEEWASNMLTVMLDSTETVSFVFKLVLFALARNPKEQEKLRTEVISCGSKLADYDYDKVASLRRMDMFINESLRVYPPLMALGKICVNTTRLGDIVVEKGTFVFIPTSYFQMSPKYFQNPTTFDPDRFANMGNIKSCSFLPFGEGPRACMGQRYATMAIKILLINVLLTFDVSLNEDLDKPVAGNKMSPFINTFKEEPKWKFTKLHSTHAQN